MQSNLDVEVEPKLAVELDVQQEVINEEPKLKPEAKQVAGAAEADHEEEKIDLIQLMNGVEKKTTSWKRKWWEPGPGQGQGQAKKKHKVDNNPEAEEINLIELMNSRPQEIQIKALPAADENGVIKYFGYMDTYFGGIPPIPVTNIIYSNDDFNEVKILSGEI